MNELRHVVPLTTSDANSYRAPIVGVWLRPANHAHTLVSDVLADPVAWAAILKCAMGRHINVMASHAPPSHAYTTIL